MASRIESRILEIAIELFADYGYYGVTTRDLAKKADVTEGSIYRLFHRKEELFEKALAAVITRSLNPAPFLLMVFEKRGKQDFPTVAAEVLHRWYLSISQFSARLLTQAYFTDPKWRKPAYGPIDKFVEIVASMLERELLNTPAGKLKATTAAKALILALLHFKITYASECSKKEEATMVDGIIQQWLQGLPFPA
jgi:AcrR family transcriptional regulator